MKLSASVPINAFAAFLSTTAGFLTTMMALVVGVAIGLIIHFNDAYMLAFNLLLSVAAIVISSAILVSGRSKRGCNSGQARPSHRILESEQQDHWSRAQRCPRDRG